MNMNNADSVSATTLKAPAIPTNSLKNWTIGMTRTTPAIAISLPTLT